MEAFTKGESIIISNDYTSNNISMLDQTRTKQEPNSTSILSSGQIQTHPNPNNDSNQEKKRKKKQTNQNANTQPQNKSTPNSDPKPPKKISLEGKTPVNFLQEYCISMRKKFQFVYEIDGNHMHACILKAASQKYIFSNSRIFQQTICCDCFDRWN